MANYLFQLESNGEGTIVVNIADAFLDETLMAISIDSNPSYGNFANYLMCGTIPEYLNHYQ